MDEQLDQHWLNDFSQPHAWHMLPKPTPEEFAAAIVDILRTEPGQKVMQGLVHQYLLAEVPNETNLARYIGRQDVVKQIMEMAGLGVQQRRQRQEVKPDGGSEWFRSGTLGDGGTW